MTPLEGLAFLFFVSCVPALLFAFPDLHRHAGRRALIALALVSLGLNRQFTVDPLQAWFLLVFAFFVSVAPVRSGRIATLMALAVLGPFVLNPSIAATASREYFAPVAIHVLLVIGGFLFSVVAGSSLVEQTLRRIKGLPGSSEEAESGRGAPAGGRVIGMLERAFAYAGVLVGHPEAAALVVAVKSVARFPEFQRKEDGRRFAEYFLIGTLLSVLFALSVAYVVQAGIRSTP